MTDTLHSFALGTATLNRDGKLIEAWYPAPLRDPDPELISAAAAAAGWRGGNHAIVLEPTQLEDLEMRLDGGSKQEVRTLVHALQSATRPVVATFLATDEAPSSVAEVYLKLHLLSHRLYRPHELNLEGAFGLLHNIAWTSEGPVDLPELPERQLQARIKGHPLSVQCVDKFPRMTDYVVPAGVRIADTSRVRLGAHVGEGTTVMHEGFINFNAGTLGAAMIEGRISAGVVIGEGSDLGGGSSTMGTLSGGGKEIISVGRDCLVGANAGIGIALGDHCVVEAGLYVTAGTQVRMYDRDGKAAGIVKARELSGRSGLLFRRNSTTGVVECRSNSTRIELNDELHQHN